MALHLASSGRHDASQVLGVGLPAMSDQIAMHDWRLSAHRALGARGCARCDATATEPDTAGVANTPPDRRASLRHDQGLDGSDAFPHQDIATREYRDESARPRLQHETSDADPRNRPAHEGNEGLKSLFATSVSSISSPIEWPSRTRRDSLNEVFTRPRSRGLIHCADAGPEPAGHSGVLRALRCDPARYLDADRRCKSLYLKAASYEFLITIGRRLEY